MPCGYAFVTSLVPSINSGYEWVCWPDTGGEDVDRPPVSAGGSGGVDMGASGGAGGGSGPSFGVDPSGTGTVVAPDTSTPDYDTTLDMNPGWNAGAHSIASVAADWVGRIGFDVPDVLGARPGGVAVGLCGVSTLPTAMRVGYAHLRYALVFTNESVKVVHDFAVVATVPYATVRAAREVDVTTDLVSALMYGPAIKWVVNGATLFAGPFTMGEPYALDAMLYTAYDAVENPVFEEGTPGETGDGVISIMFPTPTFAGELAFDPQLVVEMPSAVVRLSDVDPSEITITLPRMTVELGEGDGIDLTLGPLSFIASEAATYAAISIGFTPTVNIAIGDLEDQSEFSWLVINAPRMTVSMTAPNMASITMQMSEPFVRMSSDTVYSELTVDVPHLLFRAYMGEMTPLVQVMEFVGVRAQTVQYSHVAIAIIERVTGEATAVVYATTTADATEHVTVQDETVVHSTFFDSVAEQVAVGDRVTTVVFSVADGAMQDIGVAWAVNTESSASTRYDTYGFNSFALVGGKHYGARQDGVYLLEGPTDAGAPITSGISLGKHDFGTQALKRMDAVYAGVSSTGALFLKVGDGKTSYTYRARRKDDHMRVQRFDTGRGLRANYFDLQLTSTADAFELDSVTFHVLPSSRRI
jgi:hypothetical protein